MSGPHVLIVDDDRALLQALPEALHLRLDGVIVDTCDSATAALEHIATTDYDAIISDIKMPGIDGLALLAEIHALRPDTPTLLITGHGEHDLAVQALRGGAYDFIQKPIDREYFVASLTRAIRVRQLSRRVKELDQLKTQFFADVSHELRTPLALVLGPTRKLLATGELTAEQREDLEVIERNARTLLKRVNDLLDIAKLEAGKMGLSYAEVDLARLLCLTAAHFEVLAQERRVSLSLDTPRAVPARADPEKLQRVFLNLLSNAFKFVPDGGRVRCELRVEGDRAIAAVEDNGPGVPREFREAIFERFRQGEDATHRPFGGTGLGLAIAKEFVALHGGTIAVGDGKPRGARFSVVLPLVAPSDADAPAAAGAGDDIARQMLDELRQRRPNGEPGRAPTPKGPAHPQAGAPTPETSRALVLVVEDNPAMNRFIARTLEDDYRVATAFDGREGLEKALALRPDLILSDLMMPRMRGDALLGEVRAHAELDTVPVVLLTAKADDELRVKLLRAGAQDYLTKPVLAEELRARVANLVTMKRVRETLQAELASQGHDVTALARDLTTRQRELQASLNEKEVLLKELHHRVKNNLQVICSLLNSQSASTQDKRVRELFATSQNRVRSMALIHEQLYQSKNLATIDVAEYIRRLALNLFRSHGIDPDVIALTLDLEDVELPIDAAVPCGLIINELISNSLEHAFPPGKEGEIRVRLRCDPHGMCELTITDTGVGFAPDVTVSATESSGLHLVATLTDQLGGTLERETCEGARFRITFPRQAPS
jgi:signal transduction histidine kinase